MEQSSYQFERKQNKKPLFNRKTSSRKSLFITKEHRYLNDVKTASKTWLSIPKFIQKTQTELTVVALEASTQHTAEADELASPELWQREKPKAHTPHTRCRYIIPRCMPLTQSRRRRATPRKSACLLERVNISSLDRYANFPTSHSLLLRQARRGRTVRQS